MENITEVSAGVITDGGRILICRRAAGKSNGGCWEFPGGKLENGESAEEAVVREIREELSARVSVTEKLCNVVYDYPSFRLDMDCFLCELREGELRLLEAEEARWLGKNELFSVNWLPADILAVQKLERYLTEKGE